MFCLIRDLVLHFLKHFMDEVKYDSNIQPVVIRDLVPSKTLLIVHNTFLIAQPEAGFIETSRNM